MKEKHGRYLMYIGIALFVVGFYVVVVIAELFMGVIALLTGIWTAIKGYRISKGIKPYVIKKHEQREQEELDKERNLDPFDPKNHNKD